MLRISAPAKTNLYLGVHPQKDERGYHVVDTVMVALGVHDELCLSQAEKPSLSCEPDLGIAREQNLAWRALEGMGKLFAHPFELAVELHKQIPAQAGLGGASSDAAAVILGACELWGIDPTSEKVRTFARSLGADVAFFLDPRPSLLRGVGDVLEQSFELGGPLWLVLARAVGEGVSTPRAYACFDAEPSEPDGFEEICTALEQGSVERVAASLYNNLAAASCAISKTTREGLRALQMCDEVLAAQVCGSGSCCFAVVSDEQAAQRVAAHLGESHPDWWICATQVV